MVPGSNSEVLQFGKMEPNVYSLDFGYPFCPLQAFGVFLSAFGWAIE